MDKQTGSSGGIGVTGILTVVFVVLKLIGVESMQSVPWWSFNPIQFSVFIFWTWALWIIIVAFVIGIAVALASAFG